MDLFIQILKTIYIYYNQFKFGGFVKPVICMCWVIISFFTRFISKFLVLRYYVKPFIYQRLELRYILDYLVNLRKAKIYILDLCFIIASSLSKQTFIFKLVRLIGGRFLSLPCHLCFNTMFLTKFKLVQQFNI